MLEELLQLRQLLHRLDSLEVLLGMGPKLDRHFDGIFFGEPLATEEQTVLFPSSCKRVGAERLGGVIPSVDPGQFLKAFPPLLSKHLLLTRQLLEGAEEKILWRRCHCGGDASKERRKQGRKLFGGDASTDTNGPVHWHLRTSSRTATEENGECLLY